LFLVFPVAFSSCARKAAPAGSSGQPAQVSAGPPCIIYKTRDDYSKKVPVELSADRKTIMSYPDVKDVFIDGKPAYPTPLADGYLLDNRGIGPHVAFLKLSYEEYHALPRTPDASELLTMILSDDPLLEMYKCGTKYQYKDLVAELNGMILEGKIHECQKLK
jgi:hypothetical protein